MVSEQWLVGTAFWVPVVQDRALWVVGTSEEGEPGEEGMGEEGYKMEGKWVGCSRKSEREGGGVLIE